MSKHQRLAATHGVLGAIRIADLNAFVRVAATLSMSEVARELGVSAAVVSKRLQFLEDQFGAVFFERTTRAMRLTEAGQDFLGRLTPIIGALGDLEQALLIGVEETVLPIGRYVLGEYDDGVSIGFCGKNGTWYKGTVTEHGAATFVRQEPLCWSDLPSAL